jgi:hypothetical protein
LLTTQGLMKVKTRALRQRVWFKAATRVERGIVDLTIRCVETVRSPVLASAVLNIVSKILKVLQEGFMERAENVGREVVEKLCVIAERWGNESVTDWKQGDEFVRFLGVIALNA